MATRKQRAVAKNRAARKRARIATHMVGKKAAKRIASSHVKILSRQARVSEKRPQGKSTAAKQRKSAASASATRAAIRDIERGNKRK